MALKATKRNDLSCLNMIKNSNIKVDSNNDTSFQDAIEAFNSSNGIVKVYKNFDFTTEYEMIISEGN